MSIRSLRRPPQLPRHQRGVVLYVALILLILLTLLGIAGMQVSSMQERMSSAWRASNLAFQNAESQTKTREIAIANAAGVVIADDERCDPFDPATWAETQLAVPVNINGTFVRRADQCSPGGSLGMGQRPDSENTNTQFQITAFATDLVVAGGERSSEAVIDTIFIP